MVRARLGVTHLTVRSAAMLALGLIAGLAQGVDHPAAGPAGVELRAHIVAKGETLYGIARTLGVPLAVLQRHNGVTDPTTIKPGMRLAVPGTHTAVSYTHLRAHET